MKVIWTEQAISRLEAIRDHVSEDNPAAAIDLVERILDRGDELREMATRGRKVPELNDPKYRELIEQGYRIVYRVRENVESLTVFNGRRPLLRSEL